MFPKKNNNDYDDLNECNMIINDLKKKYDKIKTKYEELHNENTNLKFEIEKLTLKIKELEEENDCLELEIEELENK